MSDVSRRDLFRGVLPVAAGLLGLPALARRSRTSSSPYRRPKLKITDVRTARGHGARLSAPRAHLHRSGADRAGRRRRTPSGAASPLVADVPSALLVGQDPLNVDPLFERIRTFGIFAGAQAGQYVTALTAIEIALWDLAGKALGLPVYQLLGGKMRDRIRIYCDSQTEDPDRPAGASEARADPRHGLHGGQDRHRRARTIRTGGTR